MKRDSRDTYRTKSKCGCFCGNTPVSLDQHGHLETVRAKWDFGACLVQPPHFTFYKRIEALLKSAGTAV